MQDALPSYQLAPSTEILARKGFARRFLDPVHTYATRPNRSFSPPSASRIMAASNPAPAITANRSPLIRPTSIERRRPWRPISTAASMSLGISRFVASRLAVPAGTIASRTSDPGEHVDAPLHHAVPTPDEDQLRAGLDRALHLRRGLPALRDLAPERVVDPSPLQLSTQPEQPVAERLARVRDDGDLPGRDRLAHCPDAAFRARRSAATPAARAARRTTTMAPIPITTPPRTSSG